MAELGSDDRNINDGILDGVPLGITDGSSDGITVGSSVGGDSVDTLLVDEVGSMD